MSERNNINPWSGARKYRIFSFVIVVVQGKDDDPRKFYTELHGKNDEYLASMGSDMPTHLLAAIETYWKRNTPNA